MIKNELFISGPNGRVFTELYAPEGSGKKFPVVIMSHGYNSFHGHLTDLAERLAECGFVTAAYDFCGGSLRGKSEGSPIDMTLDTEEADLDAVLSAVSAMDFVDDGRVILYGESQGGYISAMYAAHHPERIEKLVLLYPALCIPEDWARFKKERPQRIDFMDMTIGIKFVDSVPDGDVYEMIAKYTNPVLIVHGDKDPVVALSYSERARQAYANARLEIVPGEGHGFTRKGRERLFELVRDFLTASDSDDS